MSKTRGFNDSESSAGFFVFWGCAEFGFPAVAAVLVDVDRCCGRRDLGSACAERYQAGGLGSSMGMQCRIIVGVVSRGTLSG